MDKGHGIERIGVYQEEGEKEEGTGGGRRFRQG